jgi:NAD(P)-dependent dehydrogenase (short-subunit alcohol dehydrogenase family)
VTGVAPVTGATRGLGRGIAAVLGAAGRFAEHLDLSGSQSPEGVGRLRRVTT